jgi:DNA gyrase subunit B
MAYSAKDVRVLDEVEHIQLNPGMYVGETSNPVHLIEEALDNALDEALAGYAKIVAVIIDTKKNVFSVLDNGRGIPIADDTPITVSSKLFSGAKFQDKKTAYQISSGLHGVGLVAVNALSEFYTVEIYRNDNHAKYEFIKAKLKKSEIKKNGKEQLQLPFSTKIEFKPDKKYFETLAPDVDRIRRRLTTASAEMENNIKFVLIIDGKKEVFQLSQAEHFSMNCLTSKDKVIARVLNSHKIPEKFTAIFAYENDGPISPRIISSVNLLPVDNGGTHVNFFYDLIKEFFMQKAKKFGYKFQPNDVLYRLRVYFMLSLIEPKFSAQTKDKLINVKTYFDRFTSAFKVQLDHHFQEQEDYFKELMETFQEYRAKLDSKKIKTNGTSTKRAATKFTKLRDCTTRGGELYIVEGDSAGGSIIQSRDPRIHAILPLKGKSIPNVTTKKSILGNKEVGELVRALGTGIGPEFNLSNIRYSKIICATDADPDGAHIACLVSMVMAILLPEVVKAGMYFIAQTPLFAINEGRTFKPIWSEKELEKAREANRTIQRYKGLGEMNPSQLKISLLDEPTRHLTSVAYSDDIDSLIKLFSSATEKRKLVTT